MRILIAALIMMTTLTGCTSESEQDKSVSDEVTMPAAGAVEENQVTIEPIKPLDLSPPPIEWLYLDGSPDDRISAGSSYSKVPKLLEPRETKDWMSVVVIPSFKSTESFTDMPELDGGSVSVEVKTE
jgi:hypothetical protein